PARQDSRHATVCDRPVDPHALVMGGGTAQHEPSLGELVDHAAEIRWIDAAPPGQLLERGRVTDLEPPEQLRLRVGEAERLEKRALMVERLGEQIHQAPHDLFARPGIATHYRYFTVLLALV